MKRIRDRWPKADARKVPKSEVLAWLLPSNLERAHTISTLSAFARFSDFAVDDRKLARSPVDGVKEKRRSTPIRLTSSMGDFAAIVKIIREQPFSDTAEKSADLVEFMDWPAWARRKPLIWR